MDAPEDEEAQLAATLAALEAKASRHITELFKSNLDDRAAFNTQLTRIREDLASLRAATRDLAILTEEQDTEEQAARLAEMLTGHQAEYERLQTAFKQANIQARRNMEAAAAAVRKALLAGGEAAAAPGRAAGQASAVATSQGITKSLLRTRQLMSQELEHTSATLAAMDASNDRLAEGREELRMHRGLFGTSRRLLRALFTSSVLDTLSLYGGLAIFFLVVAYILQKRTLYFAPVGKYMAPVAGTAWNASRAAASRAGQLPGAVLALQRRLRDKGGGSGAVESVLPATQQQQLQAAVDSAADSNAAEQQHLQQQQEGHQEDDRPSNGGGGGGGPAGDGDEHSEPQQPGTPQQWAEAEPDPLADIELAPEDSALPADDLLAEDELPPSQSAQPESKSEEPDWLPDVPGGGNKPPARDTASADTGPGDEAVVTAANSSAEAHAAPAQPGGKPDAQAPADEQPPDGNAAEAAGMDTGSLPAGKAAHIEQAGADLAAAAADEPPVAADELPAAVKGSSEQGAGEAGAANRGSMDANAAVAEAAKAATEAPADGGDAKAAGKVAAPEPLPSSIGDGEGKAPMELAAEAKPLPSSAGGKAQAAEADAKADVPPGESTEPPAEDGQPPAAAAAQPDEAVRQLEEPAEAESAAVAEPAEPAAKPAQPRKPVGRIEPLVAGKAGGVAAAEQHPGAKDAMQGEVPAAAAAEEGWQPAADADASGAAEPLTEEAQQPAPAEAAGPVEPDAVDETPAGLSSADGGPVVMPPLEPSEEGGPVVMPPSEAADPLAALGVRSSPPAAADDNSGGAVDISVPPQPEPQPGTVAKADGDAPSLTKSEAPAAAASDPVAAAEPPQSEEAPEASDPLADAEHDANLLSQGDGPLQADGAPAEPSGGGVDDDAGNKVWDEHGDEFEWRWNTGKGPRGTWQLFAAGTDTIVLEQDPDEAAPAPDAEAAVDEPPPAEPVHDEL